MSNIEPGTPFRIDDRNFILDDLEHDAPVLWDITEEPWVKVAAFSEEYDMAFVIYAAKEYLKALRQGYG